MEKKDLLYLAISSAILTIIWIASNIHHAYATSTIDDTVAAQIAPITPDFDMETIIKLRNRTPISPQENLPKATTTPSPVDASPTEQPITVETPSPTVAEPIQEVEISITPTEEPTQTQP